MNILEERWYNLDVEKALKKLETSRNGLTEEEYKKRSSVYGLNELEKEKKVSKLTIFFRQFLNPIIAVLLIVAVISYFLGEYSDVGVILAVLFLNSTVGMVQEYKAERTIEALKKMVAPITRVIRNKIEIEVSASEIVPGDIVILRVGDKIPADCRLVHEEEDIRVDESILTGESTPVEKENIVLKGDIPLAERINMLYSGTLITTGKCQALVVATGMDTEIGNIQNLVQLTKKPKTPFQRRLAGFTKLLGISIFLVSVALFFVGVLFGVSYREIFKIVAANAVSITPEGLPVVITLVLAVGMYRMAQKNAIIRRLPVVETLGTTNVICADKTGTLTQNKMTVRKIYINGKTIDVTGVGYKPEGGFLIGKKNIKPGKNPHLELLLKVGVLCNTAALKEESGNWYVDGDPTEGALLVAGAKMNIEQHKLKDKYVLIDEIPFSHERKIRTTIHETKDGNRFAFSIGAPEVLLKSCTKVYEDGRLPMLTRNERENILERDNKLASEALRVLAVSYRKLSHRIKEFTPESVERELVFVGLIGMMDPPREEAKLAINACENAGIKVVMITGDHKITATAIAKELGLLKENSLVMTGEEIDSMKPHEFYRIVENVSVYARVTPEQKLEIVKALRRRRHIVAVTGDGVNDAPALKTANIGISMGSGTEVAKETSGMILTDDNFVSIASAVEVGRIIYGNIKKVVMYLLSTSMGEVLTIFASIFLGLPLPITPSQILWVNLVTDGPSDVALGMEPKEGDEMKRKPYSPKEKILTRKMFYHMIIMAVIMTVGTIGLFMYELQTGSLERARTIAYTTIAMFQLFNVLNCRSFTKSMFRVGILNNKYLIAGIIGSLIAQITVIYTPLLQKIFNAVPLTLFDWIAIILVSSSIFIIFEIIKYIRFIRRTLRKKEH